MARVKVVDVMLVAAGMLSGLSMSLLTPVLPQIEAEFAATPGIAYLGKLVVSVVGLAILLTAPLAAPAVRRFGAERVLLAAFAVYALAAAAGGLAPSIYALIATRFVQGVCVATGVTTALALINTLYQGGARDRRVGMHVAFSALLLSALLPLGGWLGETSWRLTPLLGAVSLLHLLLAIRARGELGKALIGAPGPSARLAADRRSVAFMGVLALMVGVAMYSPPAFLPFKAADIGVTASGQIGLLSTLQMIVATAASLLYGSISTRLSARTVYFGAFGLAGLGTLGVALSGDWMQLAIGLMVAGSGGGTLVPHLFAESAARVGAADQVRIAGILKSASFLGLFVGPLLLQTVMGASSPAGAFVALAVLNAVALVATQLRGPAPAVVPAE